MTVHPAFLWLAVVVLATFLVFALTPRLWQHSKCTHGESSIVMVNGKVQRAHQTGCLP